MVFQSNRCGVETRDDPAREIAAPLFQSNRCGVETVEVPVIEGIERHSNRTVAGLKRLDFFDIYDLQFQSNRCGVETMSPFRVEMVLTDSNRTVAGLKPTA